MFLYFALLVSVVSLHGMMDGDGFIWVGNDTAWEKHNETPLDFNAVPQKLVLSTVTGDTAFVGMPIWRQGARLLPTNGTPMNDKKPLIIVTSETAKNIRLDNTRDLPQ